MSVSEHLRPDSLQEGQTMTDIKDSAEANGRLNGIDSRTHIYLTSSFVVLGLALLVPLALDWLNVSQEKDIMFMTMMTVSSFILLMLLGGSRKEIETVERFVIDENEVDVHSPLFDRCEEVRGFTMNAFILGIASFVVVFAMTVRAVLS